MIPPTSRTLSLDTDPHGVKALLIKYDIIYIDIVRASGPRGSIESARHRVSNTLSGRGGGCRWVFVAITGLLKARGASDEEIARVSGLGAGYRYKSPRATTGKTE